MDPNSTSKVLVTGGAGFIGSHTTDRLVHAGYNVRVVDNLSTGNFANISQHVEQGLVDFVRGDIRELDLTSKLVRDVDCIVHLAAITSVPFSVKNPALTQEVNVKGTYNLLNSCTKNNTKRFIFISSCSVYGEPEYLPVDEKHPTAPLSPYASSKLEAERHCNASNEKVHLRTAILRLFNVYGSRQGLSEYSGVITKFINNVQQGQPLVIYGDGSQTRDFIHVWDVADVIFEFVRKEKIEGTFNIGYSNPVSINDLAKTVLKASGKNGEIIYKPARSGDVVHSFANIKKAAEKFGYSPKIPLEKGIKGLLNETGDYQ